MKPFQQLLIAAALSAAFASPALAASSASASLTNLSLTLVDLNPLDNVTPGITWANVDGYGSYAYGYAYDNSGNTASQGYSQFGTSNFSNVAASVTNPLSSASASLVQGPNTGNPDGASLKASGSTAGATLPGHASAFYTYVLAPYWSTNFTLTANTLAIFRATATVQASTTVGYASLNGRSEYANAYAYVQASGVGASGTGSQNSYAQPNVYATYLATYDPQTNAYLYTGQSQSSTQDVAVTFANLTGSNLDGNFYAYAFATGQSSIAAVPEPESYAMFLAGLCLIAGIARRRRS